MNINPLIISALDGLTFGGKAVSVTPIVYTGVDTTYIIFSTYLDTDEAFADDGPIGGNSYGTVDIFCKMLGNYKGLVESVKTKLRAAGFNTSTGPERYEKDTTFYHVSIDINIENMEA